jgi:hypothetical protein
MGLEEFFGREFAEKYRKFESKHYEPLPSGEIEEIKKQARHMLPESSRVEWKGYDVILVSTPDSLEKLRSTTARGNEKIAFLWRGEWISAFLPLELAEKIEPKSYYLLVGRLREREWQGSSSYSMSVNDAILIGKVEVEVEEKVEVKEKVEERAAEIEIPSLELISKVERAASLLGGEKLTPKFLKEMGIVDQRTSDSLIQKAIDKVKKQGQTQTPSQSQPQKASTSISPELQVTINRVKEAFSILGYDGFTLQAVRALGVAPEVQDKVLERIIERVKKGEL